MISTFTAFFDANVFFGARLRSLIMELTQTGLFRARWSDDVHREWMEAVAKSRESLTVADLEPTRQAMDDAVLDCLVRDYEPLIEGIQLPDAKDRHVVAAAMAARANVIVTFNMKDFPEGDLVRWGLHAKHPDDFLLDLESIDHEEFLGAVLKDMRHYKRPPIEVDRYLADLEKAGIPNTVARLRVLKVLLSE